MINPMVIARLLKGMNGGSLSFEQIEELFTGMGMDIRLSKVESSSDIPPVPEGSRVVKFEVGEKGKGVAQLIGIFIVPPTYTLPLPPHKLSEPTSVTGNQQPLYNFS